MKENKSVIIGSIILIVLGLGYFSYTKWFSEGNKESMSSITSFTVEKPDLVVKGIKLSSVEIWAVPSGTEITENDYIMLGKATLMSEDESGQIWKFPIPEEPLLVTDIFAKGFDAKGNVVSRISSPYSGATEIYSKVWGPVSEKKITLKVGEKGTFEGLNIKLNKIVNDSRCAKGVECVWAGEVVAEVEATANGKTKTLEIKSSANPPLFEGYFIELSKIEPEKVSGVNILAKDYKLTFTLSRNAKE